MLWLCLGCTGTELPAWIFYEKKQLRVTFGLIPSCPAAPHCPASSSHPWETGDVLSPPVGCKAQHQDLSLPHVLVTSEASHSKKKGNWSVNQTATGCC